MKKRHKWQRAEIQGLKVVQSSECLGKVHSSKESNA
jgi:hypothetical protein